MEAGRELDRLVAERVMGYTVYHYDKDREANCYYMLMDAACNSALIGWGGNPLAARRKTEAEAWADCPPFSTSLEAAWLVVGRMRRHREGRNLQLIAYAYNRTYATFVLHAGDHDDWAEANGEHATPAAICLAALEECPAGMDVWLPAELFSDGDV